MNSKLTNEEIILYSLTTLVLVGIFFLFYEVIVATRNPAAASYIVQDVEGLKLGKDSIPKEDLLQYEWMKAQLQVVSKRYELASRINLSYSYINYIAFIVGTVLCLLGTIVIFKGVQSDPTEAGVSASQQIKFKISTSSPGLFMSFLGTVIIIVSITFRGGDSVTVKDDGIVIGIEGVTKSKVLSKTDISFLTQDQRQKLLSLSEEDRNRILKMSQDEIKNILNNK